MGFEIAEVLRETEDFFVSLAEETIIVGLSDQKIVNFSRDLVMEKC